MLGYAPGATAGTNAFDLVHPDDQVGALEGFASTMGSSDSRPIPLLVRLGSRPLPSDKDCHG